MGWLRRVARPSVVEKAAVTEKLPARGPRRWSFNPNLAEWQFATEAPSESHPGTLGLNYATLHAMSRVPVIGAIIQTRINQVAEFARPQPDPYSLGYRIRHRDPEREATARDRSRVKAITEVIERGGGSYWYGGFEGFLRAVVRDSLTYDQANFEVIRDRGGRPWGFAPVDASTIRRARPSEAAMQTGRLDPQDIAFVQIVDDKIVNEFSRHELAWCVRRPRTLMHSYGYGFPELEEMIDVVTDYLNAKTYNAVNFTNGIHARTIVALKSTMDASMFKAFKREVIAMMSGVANAKRVPIIQLDPEFKEDMSAIPLDRSNKEMEYQNWMNFLMKVLCSGYQMDPSEINFVFGNEGQTSSLQSASVGDRVTMSREKGLRPLLRSVEYWLNEWVVQPLDDSYLIEFVGFDAATEEQRIELDTKTVKSFRTVDEIRAQHDLEPMKDGLGEIILDPTWMQAKSAADMAAQQEQMGAMDDELGPGGEEGGFEGLGGEDLGGGEELGDMDELLAASQAVSYGQVDAVEALATRLQRIYDRRTKALAALLRRKKT